MTLHPAHAIGPNPLSEHALSHVLSEVLDNYAPTDEDEIRIALRDARYRPAEIAQVMEAWADYWERTPTCAACGKAATMRFGILDIETGRVSSMDGLDHFSLSCNDCAECDPQQHGPIVRAPLSLEMWRPNANLDFLRGMLDKFDDEQLNRDRPFRTYRPDQGQVTPGPLERVQRALDWIANLREVPFR
jgi:hypothetical protein